MKTRKSVNLDNVMIGPQPPPVPPVVYSEALIDKLRANTFEGRRKAVETQKVDEQKLFPLMWSRMSTGSKSKVHEEPGFEAARLRLDSVKLWEYIRSVTRTPVRAVRVQAYVRTGSRTIRSIRFIAMIPAVFTRKLTTLFP